MLDTKTQNEIRERWERYVKVAEETIGIPLNIETTADFWLSEIQTLLKAERAEANIRATEIISRYFMGINHVPTMDVLEVIQRAILDDPLLSSYKNKQ